MAAKWTFGTLRRYLDAKLAAMGRLLDERYATQTKALDKAFESAERAVQKALESAEKALAKLEAAYEKRFEGQNEFREQLREQQRTFVTGDVFEARLASMTEKLDGLQRWRDSSEGQVRGAGGNEATRRLDTGTRLAIASVAISVIGTSTAVIIAVTK